MTYTRKIGEYRLFALSAVIFAAILFFPFSAPSQPYMYTQEQLDELLAPIALYPDPLLSQILMAATYPTEIADADNFIRANRLTGDRLDQALQYQPWDVSVKSLCHYPDILSTMAGYMDQTTALGDAFLSQPDDVLDTVQRLRWRAYEAGRLRSTSEQQVIIEDRYIAINLASPQIVYVPVYDPCWVYGTWWWPTCNRVWFWYPGQRAYGRFFFRRPIRVGHRGPWSGFRWNRHSIYVDPDRTVGFNRVPATRAYSGQHTWVHDPTHRRGVAYRNPATGPSAPDNRARYRGFPASAPGSPTPASPRAPSGPQAQPRQGRVERPSPGAPSVTQAPPAAAPRRPAPEIQREAPPQKAPARTPTAETPRPSPPASAAVRPPSAPSGRTGALSAPPIGSPYARQESERGKSSLRSRPESRPKSQAAAAPPSAAPTAPRAAPAPKPAPAPTPKPAPAPSAAPAPKPAPAPPAAPAPKPAPAPHAAPAPTPAPAPHAGPPPARPAPSKEGPERHR